MKTIPLTKGKEALVDDDDYDFLTQWKWYAEPSGNTFYAIRRPRVDGKRQTFWMHRMVNKTPPELLTDHKNGDGLDNQKANLRNATHQDNMINCARPKSASSRFRGVSWHKSNKRWIAQITINYRNIYIGAFPTEEAAKSAYDARRQELRAGKLFRMEA